MSEGAPTPYRRADRARSRSALRCPTGRTTSARWRGGSPSWTGRPPRSGRRELAGEPAQSVRICDVAVLDVVAWGPELTFFYNDAYRVTRSAAKHPWALGRRAREVWAEIWDDIGPAHPAVLAAAWRPGTSTCSCSWSAGGTSRRPTTPSRTARSGRRGCIGGAVRGHRGHRAGRRRTADGHPRDSRRDTGDAHRAPTPAPPPPRCWPQGRRRAVRARSTCSTTTAPPGAAGPAAGAAAAPGRSAAASRGRRGRSAGWRRRLGDGRGRAPRFAAAGRPVAAPRRRRPSLPLASAGHRPVRGSSSPGSARYRPLDDGYRGFLDLVGRPDRAPGSATPRGLRGGAAARRGAGRAGPGQDGLLHQRQPRVPHPADADLGPVAELRASPADRPTRGRATSSRSSHRNALRLLQAGEHAAGLLPARGRPDATRASSPPTSPRSPRSWPASSARRASGPACDFDGGLPAAGRAGVRRPGDVGEGRPQPALQRLQVHLRRRRSPSRCAGDGGTAVLTVTDTGIGIPADELPRLFERFHRVPRARGAHPRGQRHRPGAGAGAGRAARRRRSTSRAPPAAGPRSPSPLPLGSAHLPAEPGRPRRTPSAAGVSAAAAPFVAEALRWLPRADAGEPAAPPGRGPAARPAGRVLVADDNADMRDYLTRLLRPRYASRRSPTGRPPWRRPAPTRPTCPHRRDDARPGRLRAARRLRADPRNRPRAGGPALGPRRRGGRGRGARRRRRRLPGQAVLRRRSCWPGSGAHSSWAERRRAAEEQFPRARPTSPAGG